jgi:hypothetical protein
LVARAEQEIFSCRRADVRTVLDGSMGLDFRRDSVLVRRPTKLLAMTLPCDSCAVPYESMDVAAAHDAIAELGAKYRKLFAPLLDEPSRLRQRPTPGVWAPIEYAAHVRDALRYHGATINRALTEDGPVLPEPDPDQAARDADYLNEDPPSVLVAIDAQARRLASRVLELDRIDLERVVHRGDRQVTVLSMVRNVAHEGAHHLLDVERILSVDDQRGCARTKGRGPHAGDAT